MGRSSCCLTVIRRVALAEQELLTLPGHQGSLTLCVVGFVFLNLVFCVLFCLSWGFVLFGQCIVCPSSTYTSDYPFVLFSFFFLAIVFVCPSLAIVFVCPSLTIVVVCPSLSIVLVCPSLTALWQRQVCSLWT